MRSGAERVSAGSLSERVQDSQEERASGSTGIFALARKMPDGAVRKGS